ncbi:MULTISPECIES: hypothetical protein [Priestia]|uniref:hypothetical protein n=1 Tax=Priestia TaxID=2800373 RepID=UPI000C9BE368|nr:hypothetical protein [Priestia megaterium]PNE08451.1 hypothetical protein C1Y47_06595 [Priestia megaterium]
MTILKDVAYALMPLIKTKLINSKIEADRKITWKKIITRKPNEEIQMFVEIEEEDAEYLLKGLRDNINSLQDKAKITAVAVTLAFSMVGGISSYLLNLKEKLYANEILTGALIFFIIASCFYLITAGYFSLVTLNSREKYDFGPKDFRYLRGLSFKNDKRKQKLLMMGEQYQMTTYDNRILNNNVDCSNNNLRNALISLGIFFVLICFSFFMAEKIQSDKQSKAVIEQTKVLKNIEGEIQTLNKDLEGLQKDSKDNYLKLNSSIEQLNNLVKQSAVGKTVQEKK